MRYGRARAELRLPVIDGDMPSEWVEIKMQTHPPVTIRDRLRAGSIVSALLLCGVLLLGFAVGQAQAATYASASTTFNWIDPSAHTRVTWTSGAACSPGSYFSAPVDDDITAQLPLGFTFNYGGVNYTQVQIMSNGRLQFNNSFCGFGTQTVGPPPTYPYPYPNANVVRTMRVYGPDLDATPSGGAGACPTATCYVSYATVGSAPNRQFVVTWVNVPEWGAVTRTGSFNLQAILDESTNEFVYQFGTSSHPTGGAAQIGWELSTTDFDVWSTPVVPPANSAVRFFLPGPIAEFRMDEAAWSGAGSVINSTASGTHGSPVGAAQTVTGGKVCRGGNIPSNTSAAAIDAVNTGYDVDSQVGSSGAITFWYKSNVAWNGGSSQDSQLFDATVANNGRFYLVKQNGNGRLSFNITNNANNNFEVRTDNNTIAANTWVHIGVTWNLTSVVANNRLRIYVNGALSKTATINKIEPLSAAIGTLYVGDNRSGFVTNPGTGRSANGVIDEVRLYNSEVSSAVILRDFNATRTCLAAPAIDHIRIEHDGSGLTCTPESVTVKACADATCSSLYTSGSTTVTLSSSAGSWSSNPITFTGSTTANLAVTSAQTVTLGASAVSPAAANATQCYIGATANCSLAFADSGFLFDVPNHVSESSQTVTVSAVKKADNSLACTPAFASVSKSVTFTCAYLNPATGTLPVRVGGAPLAASVASACSAGGAAVSLAFNASGIATTTVQYADVGQMQLNAQYTGSAATGDAGLVMTGADSFIAAPAAFGFSAITSAPIKAGKTFSATVTALNSASAATPNFGKESAPEGVTLTHLWMQPTGAGAVDGAFSGSVGSFTGGSATTSNLIWSEVGLIQLNAVLTSGSYLGSGLTALGASGNVGPFVPDHFDTTVTQGCVSGGYTYSGQPFAVTITAMNGAATPAVTRNYDGTANTSPNFAKQVTLTDGNAAGVGALSPATVALSAFTAGVANATPAYTFTAAQTAPTVIKLRATDTDGVTSDLFTEGVANIRGGRLVLLDAYGSELLELPVPFEAQYWNVSGGSGGYERNSADSCTQAPVPAVGSGLTFGGNLAVGETTPSINGATSGNGIFSSGDGIFRLTPPGAGNSGYVDITVNAPAWLEYNWQGAGNTDPTARATFGIRKSPIIYQRENY